MVAFLQ